MSFTYSLQKQVRIEFHGPNDVITRLLEWQMERKIFPVPRSGGVTGAGMYVAYFSPDDAFWVARWLNQNGGMAVEAIR